jgi:L-ascorbate metabolism protein UlaG (beta-lactamase superfamily)
MTTYHGAQLIEQMNTLNVGPNALAVWWLGQMGLALKGSGSAVIYIDPCLSDVAIEKGGGDPQIATRMFPPPLEPADVTNAAWVLCSHEHLDHTDPLTLGPLASASPGAQFVVTGWSLDLIQEADVAQDRITAAQVDRTLELAAGLRVTPVPAAHYALEMDPELGYRWLGFLVEWNGVRLYHAGDTIIFPGYLDQVQALAPVDIAILPANGRDSLRDEMDIIGNMWPNEAFAAADALQAEVLIPGHNDLYRGNRIPWSLFLEEWERRGSRQKFRVLQPGELFYYIQ